MAARREYEHVLEVDSPGATPITLREARSATKVRRYSIGVASGATVTFQLALATLAASTDAQYLFIRSNVEALTWWPINNSIAGRVYDLFPFSRDTSQPWSAGQIPTIGIANGAGRDAIVTIEFGANG